MSERLSRRALNRADNLLLSHADRSRVITDHFEAQNYRVRRPVPSIVLVDGFTAGEWTLEVQRGEAVLTIRTYDELPSGDAEALEAEGHRLIDFAAAGAEAREVRITPTTHE